jgi:hypothetical protein
VKEIFLQRVAQPKLELVASPSGRSGSIQREMLIVPGEALNGKRIRGYASYIR